jgi:ribosomal protein S27AE
MPQPTKINCPKCGAEMNHHAVKIEYGTDQPANSVFEGVLKNVHTCPRCGAVEMTIAT